MGDTLNKKGLAPDEEYNPEDEYSPLDLPSDDEDAAALAPDPIEAPAAEPAAVPADTEPVPEQPAFTAAVPQGAPVEAPVPPQPAPGAPYPPPPFYPAYPLSGVPYMQQPAAPQPYLTAYPPQQPYYPPQPAPAPYPVQPYAPYQAPQPPRPAPPPVQPAPISPYPEQRKENPSTVKVTTSTSTKVFLILLTALLAAMIVYFSLYIVKLAEQDKEKYAADSGDPFRGGSDYDLRNLFPDTQEGDDDDSLNSIGGDVKEFEEEITLVEDKGETQQHAEDKDETLGSPDAKAKGLELHALPKDKDNAKYTTQSAYESVADSVVTVEIYQDKITDKASDILGAGTGTVISADGYLITNAHVIRNSKAYVIRVVLNSGDSYQAKVIGFDSWADLAVLKIDAKDLTPVVFGDSALIEIGQDVIAIGSPGGEKFQNSATKGIVSAVGRELEINKYVRYIQSDAAISPGNSGGPLCNIYGQVVGINTAKTVAENYEAQTFSIPSATVKQIVDELVRYGYVRGRPRIGFSGSEVTAAQQYYGVPAGVIVSKIDEAGSLAGTDIREDDIITAIDGEEVTSFQDIYAILHKHKAGDKITLSVTRLK